MNERSKEQIRDGQGDILFAVLTDAHLTDAEDNRLMYLRSAVELIGRLPDRPAFLVFAGDLVGNQQDDAEAIHESGMNVLRQAGIPLYMLRGNTDLFTPQARFGFEENGFTFIGIDTATGEYSAAENKRLMELIERNEQSPVIIFSHYYPDALDNRSRDRMCESICKSKPLAVICGHGHRSERDLLGTGEIHLVAGIDPFKAGHQQPGVELFKISSGECQRQRALVSLVDDDAAAKFVQNIGFAIEADTITVEMLDLMERYGVAHAQIKQLSKADARRYALLAKIPGQVSLHASTPRIGAEGCIVNQGQLDLEIAFARQRKIRAITTHLPPVDASTLFTDDGKMTATPNLERIARLLADAWKGYWLAGIRIDIENTHWYDPAVLPELHGEYQLGIHPLHLLALRDQVEVLLCLRYGVVDGASIGFCLDIGHVLTNGPLAQAFGWVEWFTMLSPNIRSMHVHDVIDEPDGGRQGHLPMGIRGGLVNIEAIARLKTQRCPHAPGYLEVSGVDGMKDSLDAFRRWKEARQTILTVP